MAMNIAIIGAGLTGLFLSHRLYEAGFKVSLFEARDVTGGALRRSLISLLPATNENLELLEWARAHSPLPLHFQVQDHNPQTYNEARWRSFAGFGETDFRSVGELGFLSFTSEIRLEPGVDQLVRALTEQLPITVSCKSEVTEIRVNEGKATQIVVNGDKAIPVDQVIYTGPLPALNHLITGPGISDKNRSRIAKFHTWTAVVLDLTHPAMDGDFDGIMVIQHNSKEFEPVFGRMTPTGSQWFTLVHSEQADEHEFTGQCIRHIKRQIKRAWPDRFNNELSEKIYVIPGAFGQNSLKSKVPWQLQEISNLYLADQTLATQPGFLGKLEAIREIEKLLAPATQDESKTESPDSLT